MTENKFFFLKTKFENEGNKLDIHGFFNLVEHKIGWQEYTEILSEFIKNTYLEGEEYERLTTLGRNKLLEYEIRLEESRKDEQAKRKKLYNEAVISGWKRKTFWYIFAFGLFGGIYSGVDLLRTLTEKNDQEQNIVSDAESSSESEKQHPDNLEENNTDTVSIKSPNSITK